MSHTHHHHLRTTGRPLILMVMAICFLVFPARAQPDIGQYFGVIQVIDAPADSMEQAKFFRSYFAVFYGQDQWRSEVNNAATGLSITIGDKRTNEQMAHFDFQGNKLKMRLKDRNIGPLNSMTSNGKEEQYSFLLIDRDTVLAGVPCKMAHWYYGDSHLKPREVWYAPAIKNQKDSKFINLPGMPLMIDFQVDVYTIRYEITGISIEPPLPELFMELEEYTEIEQPAQDDKK